MGGAGGNGVRAADGQVGLPADGEVLVWGVVGLGFKPGLRIGVETGGDRGRFRFLVFRPFASNNVEGWGTKGLVRRGFDEKGRLVRLGLGGDGGFKAGENVLGGGMSVLRIAGRSLSGDDSGTSFLGQHFAVAGSLGVTFGYARSGPGGAAVGVWLGFRGRFVAGRGGVFAIFVGGDALVDFQFP